ncbi:MAG TPA: SDR family oxidoreductase [Gemmatimonadaceae bacterium]|nr:SDR family oxidoreductase [Gemmatimonadaceae bacterium]
MEVQTVVITGASAGLGRAIAQRFADDGARIGLIARGRERLESARRDVESRGGRGLVLPLDVADAAAVEQAAELVETELGPIDVWINNAMTSVFAPVSETRADEYRRVTEVNYLGFVHGTLSALRRMRPRRSGVIVQVGSALAHRSIPLQSAYCATKHAIKGFTESLYSELLHDQVGVRVTMVDMPAMNTPQFDWVRSRLPHRAQPVPPIFQPEVGADAVYYAAHHDCGPELLVAWPTLKAVVGEKFIPRYLDRMLARTGYSSQQTDEPARDRPDNLFEPVPGNWGAHGRFDDRSRSFSLELWAREHRGWLALGAAGALGLVLGSLRGDSVESEKSLPT